MPQSKKRITVNGSLCCGRLYETVDGKWYGSAHWMARKTICRLSNTTPAMEEYKKHLETLDMPGSYHYREVLIEDEIHLRGCCPVVVGDYILTWIANNYAKAWGGVGVVYASEPDDPVLIGGADINCAQVIVMPCRLDQSRVKKYAKLLGNYGGK